MTDEESSSGGRRADAFAAFLGIAATDRGAGRAQARVTVTPDHLNPHGTTHGAFLYCLAGVALAAAANDAEHSGVVSSVHVDYLRPSGAGDELLATAEVAERLPHEDLFVIRVVRGADQEVVARLQGRATRRRRS